jgi:hypothetical protein
MVAQRHDVSAQLTHYNLREARVASGTLRDVAVSSLGEGPVVHLERVVDARNNGILKRLKSHVSAKSSQLG